MFNMSSTYHKLLILFDQYIKSFLTKDHLKNVLYIIFVIIIKVTSGKSQVTSLEIDRDWQLKQFFVVC